METRMGFESILSEKAWKEEIWESASMPNSFYDCNLNAVIKEIKNLHKEYRMEKYYYKLPEKKSDILYRQDVLKDLEKECLFQGMISFSNDMAKVGKYKRNEEKSVHSLQQACWCMDGAFFYSQALVRLCKCIQESAPQSKAFRLLGRHLEEETSSPEFLTFTKEAESLMVEMTSVTYQLDISHNKIVVEKSERKQSWDEKVDKMLHNIPDEFPNYMENPFGGILQLSNLEIRLLEVIEGYDRDTFGKIRAFYKKYKKFINPTFLRLEAELQFYISFLYYKEYMEKIGFAFSYPKITEGQFRIEGCYDMALAAKNAREELPVIVNDLEYLEGEKFFVITGPNQGGKTTFARSVGQTAIFAMLGLMVPCKKAEFPFFTNVQTHFATEESMETGAGKLKEELDRLAPMMKNKVSQSLVLINELFTTAATYDAYIMGNRVMKHFMNQGCIGIYVTHIQELAKEEDGIVSLVAMVDEKDSHIRTYKMLRKPAAGSGYAADIVEKYHLTYKELKGRLAE